MTDSALPHSAPLTAGERLTCAAFAGAAVSTMVLYGDVDIGVHLDWCGIRLRVSVGPCTLCSQNLTYPQVLLDQRGSVVLGTEVALELLEGLRAGVEAKSEQSGGTDEH